MLFWILALLLLLGLGGLGWRQGAIRVACSFCGILLGALLCVPLGGLLRPAFVIFGIKNPVLTWFLGPFVVFVIINAIAKIVGLSVHKNVDVYYKYKAGDLRLALWERLNHRLGFPLGLLNGTAYLILIAFVFHALSYWTVQLATSDQEPFTLRMANQFGRGMDSSGFSKVARSVDHLSPAFYDSADVAGLIYQNPLLEARMSRYPGFLELAERQEFHDLGTDQEFANMRQKQQSISDVLNYSRVQAIVGNRDLLKQIWSTATTNLSDFKGYLESGKSGTYDSERILGRWNFDVNGAIGLLRRTRPNILSTEMQKIKRTMATTYAKTTLVVMPNLNFSLKDVPGLGDNPAQAQTFQGTWKNVDNTYLFTFAGAGGVETTLTGKIEGARLVLTGPKVGLVFSGED